jgi:hypothetical protein
MGGAPRMLAPRARRNRIGGIVPASETAHAPRWIYWSVRRSDEIIAIRLCRSNMIQKLPPTMRKMRMAVNTIATRFSAAWRSDQVEK